MGKKAFSSRHGNPSHKNDGNQKPSHGKEELKHHIYVYGTKNAGNVSVKTTEAIAYWCGCELGKDMMTLVEGEECAPEEPTAPVAPETETRTVAAALRKYDKEIDHYLKDLKQYKKNKGIVFVVIMGQCSPAMKNKLKSMSEFKQLDKDNDVIGLLKLIKNLTHAKVDIQYEHWCAMQSVRKLLLIQQHEREDLTAYYDRLVANRDVAEEQWGKLLPTKLVSDSTDEDEVRNRFQACIFLAGADKPKYGKVVEELNNQFLSGQNNYPKSVEAMMEYLSHRMDEKQKEKTPTKKKDDTEDEGIGATSLAQKGNKKKHFKCYKCGGKGHKAPDCPNESDSDSSAGASVFSGGTRNSRGSRGTKGGKSLSQIAWSG